MSKRGNIETSNGWPNHWKGIVFDKRQKSRQQETKYGVGLYLSYVIETMYSDVHCNAHLFVSLHKCT